MNRCPQIVLDDFTPDQLLGRPRPTPERVLYAAVLEMAVNDLHLPPGCKIWRMARAWFESADRAWPLSFLNVCEELQLDPTSVRRRLRLEFALNDTRGTLTDGALRE